jgi:hypothetical protein
MSEFDEKQVGEGRVVNQQQEACFEEVLERAENLFRSSDDEGALRLLLDLQERYVAATRLFDLLGEILIRRGALGEGIRYRTLFQILSSTLQIQGHDAQIATGPAPVRPARPSGEGPRPSDSTGPNAFALPTSHVTAAMGRQLMQQGHYDQAQNVFDSLLAKNPDDEELRAARESARRKIREKRVLGILERWLHHIDRMKSDRSRGA